MTADTILLGHGSGGRLSHRLVQDTIGRILGGATLHAYGDSALIPANDSQLAFTTDSYVVKPLVFPGGDIGKLAVCGTVNDLAVVGAAPRAISCGLIIEEGFSVGELERLLTSMRGAADDAGVEIVTGDTKIVRRGDADGLYINTSGIGWLPEGRALTIDAIRPGDAIIVNGPIGEHGAAVMAAREGLSADLFSDCAPLNGLIETVLRSGVRVRFMRDATRGGLASVLNEIVEGRPWGARLHEQAIPLTDAVRGFCETLGMDPLYVANEGKLVMVVDPDDKERAVDLMRSHPLGQDAAVIGEVSCESAGIVSLLTSIGGNRIVDMLTGDQLPRIC